jgi:lysozyme family protein
MTASNFDACLAFTLAQEGGLVDNPSDPAGLTNKGVTLATFLAYYPNLGADGLRVINDVQVANIYRVGYWDAYIEGDLLPPGVNLMAFDFGVTAGPGRSADYLEVVAGTTVDNVDGPITEAAIAKMPPTDVITRLSGLQRAHYKALPTFPTFGDGWLARTDRRVTAALKMIQPTGAPTS